MEDWIIDKIAEKNNVPKEDILQDIKKRLERFPSLTEDAILRMLATENGITPIKRDYKAGEINQKIAHVNISAKIKKKFPPRTVTVKGREARVMNFVIEDETGELPVVTWNENYIDKISNVKDGEHISIVNAYAKENSFNNIVELNIGSGAAISVNSNSVTKTESKQKEYKKINQVNDGETAYIKGFITRLFADDIYLVRCNICKKKVTDVCDIHGDKAISKTLKIRGILDDGIKSASITFFDKQADELLKLSEKEDLNEKLNQISFGLFQIDVSARMNKFNDSYAFTAKTVSATSYDL
ncbi:MAG: nucleic acid binding OB-fold tRNA/helicase-type [Candidatus Parvarchaeum acidophilus ARMAN-5]|uniref:Nucleic acid binding OB-fold tRNA/helicase-type n=1 Tax=Candidatus Parvarchaeum acidophilus ARMAN-5 TaxID=662762 RepID=D6GV90_PARA5|nr:MAG: nucleic acid binding OB-fold tRNA/helicase-type [Candidatus Parvarchaeum acidophilus ARMAN-5]